VASTRRRCGGRALFDDGAAAIVITLLECGGGLVLADTIAARPAVHSGPR
jgi:hypothetical protein